MLSLMLGLSCLNFCFLSFRFHLFLNHLLRSQMTSVYSLLLLAVTNTPLFQVFAPGIISRHKAFSSFQFPDKNLNGRPWYGYISKLQISIWKRGRKEKKGPTEKILILISVFDYWYEISEYFYKKVLIISCEYLTFLS